LTRRARARAVGTERPHPARAPQGAKEISRRSWITRVRQANSNSERVPRRGKRRQVTRNQRSDTDRGRRRDMPPFGIYAIMTPRIAAPRAPVNPNAIAKRSHTSQNDICATRRQGGAERGHPLNRQIRRMESCARLNRRVRKGR
jgi:hypothetical protein